MCIRDRYRYYLERRGIRDCVSRALSGVFASGPLEALGRGIRKVLPTPASSMLRYVGELSGEDVYKRQDQGNAGTGIAMLSRDLVVGRAKSRFALLALLFVLLAPGSAEAAHSSTCLLYTSRCV